MNPKTAIPVAERGTRFVIDVFGMKTLHFWRKIL
jgi:hypothetical protein